MGLGRQCFSLALLGLAAASCGVTNPVNQLEPTIEPTTERPTTERTCDTLADAFRLLTGSDPLIDLTNCDPTL